MKSINLEVNTETGELIPQIIMVDAVKAPAISIDVREVTTYHKEPGKLVKLIADQAAYATFDISTKAGRDACKSHASNIIRCISPAINESKRMAADAKKVVNQDIAFRREFENGIRELAAYHRKPLTEWEEEQDRIKQAEENRLRKIEEEKQYLIDWQDAIDYNELFDLRKAKQAKDERLAEIEKKRLFDLEVEKKANELINNSNSLDNVFSTLPHITKVPVFEDEKLIAQNEVIIDNCVAVKQLPKLTLHDVLILIATSYGVNYVDAKKLLIDVLLNEELT
jgi:hypothetical protein